ncbi:nucleotidyltransferase family protein [Candidatus Pelagibacter bacterium]|nr:nucleotidyltransferase family protein [Candidatus Pelagibacter bacterium]MDA9625074.1 nucleotidyltransferase family protein [Candidatus Pelagibacter bacterium]
MKNWKNKELFKDKNLLKEICVNENISIKNTIKKINSSAIQAAIVLNKRKKYYGIITDGDIRRALVNRISINDKVKKIVKKKSLYCSNKSSREEAEKIMQKNKILHLPILDRYKNFIGIHLQDEVISNEKLKNTVLIMAGGFGKRMRPYTLKTPKPMLKINDKPILEHIILKLKKERFKNIFISTHYLKNKIINYFKNGSLYDLDIKYIEEKKPLGTVGALGLLKKQNNSTIILCNGDVISNVNINNLLSFHKKNKAFATMAVIEYEHKNPFGVVTTKGFKLSEIIEKPIKKYYVNAGIYAFNPNILQMFKKNTKIDIPELFHNLKKEKKKTLIYPIHEAWKDLGRVEDLKK